MSRLIQNSSHKPSPRISGSSNPGMQKLQNIQKSSNRHNNPSQDSNSNVSAVSFKSILQKSTKMQPMMKELAELTVQSKEKQSQVEAQQVATPQHQTASNNNTPSKLTSAAQTNNNSRLSSLNEEEPVMSMIDSFQRLLSGHEYFRKQMLGVRMDELSKKVNLSVVPIIEVLLDRYAKEIKGKDKDYLNSLVYPITCVELWKKKDWQLMIDSISMMVIDDTNTFLML